MLTTIPSYGLAATIADTTMAAINQAFPSLEAEIFNPGAMEPLLIRLRNPLNGKCWHPIMYIWPSDRAADQLAVAVGDSQHCPAAEFTHNPKKKLYIDPAVVASATVEYVTMERARQEKAVLLQQAQNASIAAVKRLTETVKAAGLPDGSGTAPYLYFGVNRTSSGTIYGDVPQDTVAVTFNIGNAILTPEMAERLIELWKPISEVLASVPSLRDPSSKCASNGTLIN